MEVSFSIKKITEYGMCLTPACCFITAKRICAMRICNILFCILAYSLKQTIAMSVQTF